MERWKLGETENSVEEMRCLARATCSEHSPGEEVPVDRQTFEWTEFNNSMEPEVDHGSTDEEITIMPWCKRRIQ